MPKSKEEIIKIFSRVRPDYSNLLNDLNAEDYPIVESLIDGDNLYLSGKVVSYIGLLKTEKALVSLAIAAKSQKPSIRAIAAHALREFDFANFPKAKGLISELLEDSNLGVRKFALKTIDFAKLVDFKEKVQRLSLSETNERMKILSTRIKDNLDKFDNISIR